MIPSSLLTCAQTTSVCRTFVKSEYRPLRIGFDVAVNAISVDSLDSLVDERSSGFNAQGRQEEGTHFMNVIR
jgi:hypothetical protein